MGSVDDLMWKRAARHTPGVQLPGHSSGKPGKKYPDPHEGFIMKKVDEVIVCETL